MLRSVDTFTALCLGYREKESPLRNQLHEATGAIIQNREIARCFKQQLNQMVTFITGTAMLK